MDIESFMQSYKEAWETGDEKLLAALFEKDGRYHNTPFATQTGHKAIKKYWQRTKLQSDVKVDYEVVLAHAAGGIAHWHTTYQVTSEELFALWATSAGTGTVARKPGDPLPRLALDGLAVVELAPNGLCQDFRIWWHSVIDA